MGIAALPVAAIALWWTATLAVAGGSSLPIAILVAFVLIVVAPLAAALWRSSGRVAAGMRGLPWALLPWSGTAVALLVLVAPGVLGEALREHGWVFASSAAGPDHYGTRVASMLSTATADAIAPEDGVEARAGKVVEVTAPADAILVDVTVEGPAGAAALTYLWDTGASHTTLSRETAAKIGLQIPEDAPVVTLETAAGKRDAPLVVLPAIVIEGQRVEGISASICDACAEGRKSSLVGLNAMRAFESRLAGPTNTLELRPVSHASAADRTSDIARFVEMDLLGEPLVVSGHVHWRVKLTNRSPRVIERVVPQVVFNDGPTLLGSAIERIEPGAEAIALVKGAVGQGDTRFVIELQHARW